MHELEFSGDSLQPGADRPTDQDSLEPTPDDSQPQREGLPAHYRMRAERHYVDSIASVSAGIPVRLIPIRQFAGMTPLAGAEIDALARSIQAHGIIQPLLVRKTDGHYDVIAGKRRYAAAIAAGLTEVPCILHQVSDASAAALAVAENTRASAAHSQLRGAVATQLAAGVREIAGELSRLGQSIDLLRGADAGYQRDALSDLIAAQTWRTTWLANTAAFLSTGSCPKGQRRLFSTVVDDVVEAFEPERRLARVRFKVIHAPTRAVVDGSLVGLAIAGAIVVTLSFLRDVPEASVSINTQTFGDDGVGVQVTQDHVAVSREMSNRFSTGTLPPPASVTVALAAMALAHATAARGGASELVCAPEAGSSVQLTFRGLDAD